MQYDTACRGQELGGRLGRVVLACVWSPRPERNFVGVVVCPDATGWDRRWGDVLASTGSFVYRMLGDARSDAEAPAAAMKHAE